MMWGESRQASTEHSLMQSSCSCSDMQRRSISFNAYCCPSAFLVTLYTVPKLPVPSVPSITKSSKQERAMADSSRGEHLLLMGRLLRHNATRSRWYER